ncbi:MAG: S8 family serine peptidase, partial [Bacteroidetes bacterium]|nr:S8 family serine peptidase [Bacteroidota bacterium]
MKQISILLVLLLSSSFCLAQFGLMENKYLASLKSDEELSLIIKADATQVKNACALLGANFKYSYQNLSAISIKKQDLQNLYALLENSQMEIPLAQAQALMDTALIHNHVVEVHSGLSPLLQAYTGKDVVVGILDSGIYFEHEDFKNADGSSRIKFIWDQNVSNPSISPAPYNYGQEWSWIDIDNGACNHVEPANQFGHGTTVAGAACGNGLATGQYKGVAPDCDIIVVAVDYYGSDFLSKSVDAIDYVFKKADALGKPCVINTSFGSYSGSHDGRDFASLIIDALLEERPGRALVASAGNGNNINNTEANFTPTHLSYTLSSDTNF